jgi:hypothetical protein
VQATLQEIRSEEEELLQGGRDRRTPFNWGQYYMSTFARDFRLNDPDVVYLINLFIILITI